MIRKIIDEASDIGMIGTYWTGGEPFIEYEKLLNLIDYSNKKGLLPTVITNGGLIGAYGNYKNINQDLLKRAGLFNIDTKRIVESLTEAGLARIYFSVDSSHTSLKSVDSGIYNIVPAEVVSRAINEFLDEGYGIIHKFDAISYQLRITATSSGSFQKPTNQIIDYVMGNLEMKLKEQLSVNASVYENEKGEIFLKRLNIANLGDAEHLDSKILEDKTEENIFNIKCPHFIPRENAFDDGKHHGDLFINYDGIVYTCGDWAYPVGNILEESLSSIIKGINKPSLEEKFGLTRKVYNSLLTLSRQERIGEKAIGEAFRLIYFESPELVNNIKTQCGACSCLGHNKNLQHAFLKAFDKHYYKREL